MRRMCVVFTIVALMQLVPAAHAAGELKVLINGKQVVSDVPATMMASRTMLPFRAVFNALGVDDGSIKWNQQSKCIEVNNGSGYIFLAVGGTIALVNGNPVTLDAPPYIERGRTFVPVRFVCETLGADVQWYENTKTVSITK